MLRYAAPVPKSSENENHILPVGRIEAIKPAFKPVFANFSAIGKFFGRDFLTRFRGPNAPNRLQRRHRCMVCVHRCKCSQAVMLGDESGRYGGPAECSIAKSVPQPHAGPAASNHSLGCTTLRGARRTPRSDWNRQGRRHPQTRARLEVSPGVQSRPGCSVARGTESPGMQCRRGQKPSPAHSERVMAAIAVDARGWYGPG